MAQASSIPLTAYRGDSPVFTFTLDDGATPPAAIDITGFVFEMTVDTQEFPSDALSQQFTVTGVLADAPGGVFSFQPTTVNLSTDITPPAAGVESVELFYDISLVNGTEKVTIIKSTLTVFQDIGKA